MNTMQLRGNWNMFRGGLLVCWSRMINDRRGRVNGRLLRLFGRSQVRFGRCCRAFGR